eukprot:gene6783-7885_t
MEYFKSCFQYLFNFSSKRSDRDDGDNVDSQSQTHTPNVTTDISSNSNNSNSNNIRKLDNNKEELFSIDFSSWSKSKDELVECSVSIFEEIGLIQELKVSKETVLSYIATVRTNYRDNPFHSFNHAVTAADISNEVRSWDVSNKWANALLEEFFAQSDLEKQKNLPLTPFMVKEVYYHL